MLVDVCLELVEVLRRADTTFTVFPRLTLPVVRLERARR